MAVTTRSQPEADEPRAQRRSSIGKVDVGFAKGKSIYVGIDVHKKDWVVTVLCQGEEVYHAEKADRRIMITGNGWHNLNVARSQCRSRSMRATNRSLVIKNLKKERYG